MSVDERLEALGLVLPGEMRLPPGVEILFQWVRVRGTRNGDPSTKLGYGLERSKVNR